jgi:hypothetical protein
MTPRSQLPALLLTTLMGAGAALAAPPASPYQPLGFLVGHCWKGTFADGKVTDEHCFSWIYGGKFVRDEHTVHRDGGPDGFGESIYVGDAASGTLEYLYIESGGGYSRGAVCADGATLVFPAASYREDGKEQVYRSRWQRQGDDAYDVVTEFQAKQGWVPGFTVHMRRVGAASGGRVGSGAAALAGRAPHRAAHERALAEQRLDEIDRQHRGLVAHIEGGVELDHVE